MEGQVYLIVAIVGIVIIVGTFYFWGYQALAAYPNILSVEVKFHQKGASGWSNDNFITQAGGARGVLEVVVTEQELWTRTSFFFAPFARMYRLFHKIALNRITQTKRLNKRQVEVFYRDAIGDTRSLTLSLRDIDSFLSTLPSENQ